ncbi:MAG: GTPase Era [bacterium]
MKSGFVSIIGRPNVGKSTLMNAILGQKIAIMSDKPQTTRNIISGIYTKEDCQIIFVDTPGIHKPVSELGQRMTEAAYSQIKGVDAIFYMVSSYDKAGLGDEMILEKLKTAKSPVYLIINKIDLLKNRADIDKVIMEYKDKIDFKGVFPVSAKEKTNLTFLLDEIKELLPEGPQYYPADQVTDHPEQFIICEMIREKILYFTKEEVPHSVAVTIEYMQPSKDIPDVIECHANIFVERKSQKGILIGHQGQMMKKIKQNAKRDIRNLLGNNIDLQLWVKVKDDWRNKSASLRVLGYHTDNF